MVGGAICIDAFNYAIQNFLIENSDFEDNFSGNGGAIGVEINALNLSGTIQKNYFLRNWGACKFFFFFFFLCRTNIVGGNIRIKTFSYFTSFSILNNVFEKGVADWGGFFDFEVFFAVYAANNVFLHGIGISYFGNGIGTGSVMIMSSGTDIKYSTYVGYNNTYMFGFGENRGYYFYFIS